MTGPDRRKNGGGYRVGALCGPHNRIARRGLAGSSRRGAAWIGWPGSDRIARGAWHGSAGPDRIAHGWIGWTGSRGGAALGRWRLRGRLAGWTPTGGRPPVLPTRPTPHYNSISAVRGPLFSVLPYFDPHPSVPPKIQNGSPCRDPQNKKCPQCGHTGDSRQKAIGERTYSTPKIFFPYIVSSVNVDTT